MKKFLLALFPALALAQVTPSIAPQTVIGNGTGTQHAQQQLATLPFPENVPFQSVIVGQGFVLFAQPVMAPGNVEVAECLANSYNSVYSVTITNGHNTYPVSGTEVSPVTGTTYSATYPAYAPNGYESCLDVKVVCPNSYLPLGFHIFGGRSVDTIGCSQQPTASSGLSSGGYVYYGQSANIYIEGVQTDDSLTTSFQDFIDVSGIANTAIIGTACGITGSWTKGSQYISLSSVTGCGVSIAAGMSMGTPNGGQNGSPIYNQILGVNPSGCSAPCAAVTRAMTATQSNITMQFFTEYYPTVVIQNSNSNHMKGCDLTISGCSSTLHSDSVVQVQGPINGICIFNVTGRGNFNGLNIDAQAPIGFARVVNLNVDFQTNNGNDAYTSFILLDVSNGAPVSYEHPYPITFQNFYAEVNQTFGFVNGLPTYVGSSCGGVAGCGFYTAYVPLNTPSPTPSGTPITWGQLMQITGEAIAGDPFGGDYSPVTMTGQNYTALPNLGRPCQ